jgi:hypothetical protein
MRELFRNKYSHVEPLWHVQVAMLLAIVLQFLLPDRLVFGSRDALLVAEILLLAALSLTTPKERIFRSLTRRINVLMLLAMSGLANCYGLLVVSNNLLHAGSLANGRDLILSAVNIYLTNIVLFGLFYWEMDGGGPGERQRAPKHARDFMFPQNQNEDYRHPDWRPTFVDYVYVSSTNAMAFSPTDTLPLSRRAKLLMLFQAGISLVTIALVAARAINILH